jgi:tetratricopeptide (TPR) repeat protein
VELAEQLEDAPALVLSLYGIWEYWVVLGEHRVATALAERCIQIGAAGLEEDEARLLASAISGHQRLYLGDFERARSELEVAGRHLHVPETAVMQHHAAVVSLAALPVAMWFLGETDASRATALEATAVSESLDPTGRRTPFTRAYVGCLLAWRAELDGDHDGSIAFAEEAMELATKHGYPTWLAAATLHRSIAVCGKGLYDEGLPVLTMMVEAWRAAGRDPDGSQRYPVLMSPYFAGRLAEALLATGDLEQAATVLDRTLIESSGNGERLWGVQLLRLRAELARLQGGPPQVIEADLQEARQLAQRQGARALLAQLAVASAAATKVGP